MVKKENFQHVYISIYLCFANKNHEIWGDIEEYYHLSVIDEDCISPNVIKFALFSFIVYGSIPLYQKKDGDCI